MKRKELNLLRTNKHKFKHVPFFIIVYFSLVPLSLFLSGTTSTGQGIRSWAWLGWLRTSWQRSQTSCCPSWRVGESNPDPLCPPPPTSPQCPPSPQPPLLPSRTATCTPEVRTTGGAVHFHKGRCMFVSHCVYVCVAWFMVVATVDWKGHLPEENTFLLWWGLTEEDLDCKCRVCSYPLHQMEFNPFSSVISSNISNEWQALLQTFLPAQLLQSTLLQFLCHFPAHSDRAVTV